MDAIAGRMRELHPAFGRRPMTYDDAIRATQAAGLGLLDRLDAIALRVERLEGLAGVGHQPPQLRITAAGPAKVIDLMEVLKRSLALHKGAPA